MTSPGLYTVNEHELSFRVLDGEAVIISSSTGYYYSLNRSGTVLWNLLLGGRAPSDAAASLAATYGVDAATVLADVEKVLGLLVAENLVTQRAAEPGHGAAGNGSSPVVADHPYEQPQLVKFDRLQRLMVCGE